MKTASILFLILSFIGVSFSAGDNEAVKSPADQTQTPITIKDEPQTVITESANDESDNIQIAKCLSGKSVKLYGSYTCSHCNNQKKMFGDGVTYLNYVECNAGGENADPKSCGAAKITAYPTWVNAKKEQLVGSRDPETVAKWAGCQI